MLTPIYKLNNGAYLKLENMNFGGSHKVRSAKRMIEDAIISGSLIKGSGQIIIEKTGGNLGVGLAIFANKYGFELELAVGLSYSYAKRKMLEIYGAKLIGIEMLERGARPKDVIEHYLVNAKKMGKNYFYVDQFNNHSNFLAHYEETSKEIIAYAKSLMLVKDKKIIYVGGVGSGASTSGIGLALKEQFDDVEIIVVQPKGCDIEKEVFVEHNLQGIAVGVKPAIYLSNIVDRYIVCSEEDAYRCQKWLAREHGIFCGNSSGANIYAIKQVQKQYHQEEVIVFSLIYDSGDCYV
ncbi:PLP-dependent cysteine synthase family protein [Aerosakkonemataceae cyanobacterium BLCC-F50]|uniref:PLP-dependent cysteine synthase family protein n=1 Tax=Floridaenema flaviceps BLCC-F50 TaxID=3153642 RepID=A0ABV4Y1V4_9CYAN